MDDNRYLDNPPDKDFPCRSLLACLLQIFQHPLVFKVDLVKTEQLLDKILEQLIYLNSSFNRFTVEKKQRWKDELARRRERCW